MKQVNWVVQKNIIREETLGRLRKAFRENQISYEEVFVVPFSHELPPLQHPEVFNVFYGSTTLMLNAFRHPLYREGVFYHPDRFQMSNYLCQWKDHLLNRDGEVISFRQLIRSSRDDNSQWFLRPNADDKSFSGTVMPFALIKAWVEKIEQVDNAALSGDSLVFVSSPKRIEQEWRNFIVDGQIVSSSRYQVGGQLSVSATDIPAGMIAFVEARCREYVPHRIFVMDVAQTEGDYAILECNCFNGTGFYANDVGKVVKAVTQLLEQVYCS